LTNVTKGDGIYPVNELPKSKNAREQNYAVEVGIKVGVFSKYG
jgi:hypothetical protein